MVAFEATNGSLQALNLRYLRWLMQDVEYEVCWPVYPYPLQCYSSYVILSFTVEPLFFNLISAKISQAGPDQ
ncbi:hypothetical protein Pdw03_5732 [Penicillium digitatum]|uniref:Uncharacterized protein n=1 Tax=Penicillium digitatum TaxID=36651 RepID=A0A7T7BQ74_PENDI|nr:hypothetical protein Pdw03_5732 [Penicillium digitatum]